MREKTIKGWIVIDWKEGTHRTRKSKPGSLGTNELLAKLSIDVEIPDVDVADAVVSALGRELGGGPQRLDPVPRDAGDLVGDGAQLLVVDGAAPEALVGAVAEDRREPTDAVPLEADRRRESAPDVVAHAGEPSFLVVADPDNRHARDVDDVVEDPGVREGIGLVDYSSALSSSSTCRSSYSLHD